MIRSLEHGVEKGESLLSLLDPDIVEKLPAIQELKTQFGSIVPPRFGNIRTLISPVPNLESVMRADCQNTDCGVRTYIHINSTGGLWQFTDKEPTFDRFQNARCDDCKELLRITHLPKAQRNHFKTFPSTV